jgi:hypothetical protein
MPTMPEPVPISLQALPAPPDDGEAGWLWRAHSRGLAVTPIVIVPTEVERRYYLLNNLPERLRRLFTGVDLEDPDEDDLEDLAPAAVALVRGHALLDEVVEALYGALEPLPTTVVVRRSSAPPPPGAAEDADRAPDGAGIAPDRAGIAPDRAGVAPDEAGIAREEAGVAPDGARVASGRPALLALKRLWADEWRHEAVARRLAAGHGLVPEARPLLIHDARVRQVAAAERPEGVARVWCDLSGRLARVELIGA